MSVRLKLGLIYGGPSAEHDVSIRSATEVLAALDSDRFEAVPIAISRAGSCHTGSVNAPLGSLMSNGATDFDALVRSCDVVFPVVQYIHQKISVAYRWHIFEEVIGNCLATVIEICCRNRLF